ncbi:MAG: hypothetical protein HZA54_02475, partial [Planctomycetes bacterium]|nr:hypothetical protein [Planctomycetota bacterium]
ARLRASAPAATDRLARRVGIFARRLERLRLAPRHLDAAYGAGTVGGFALRNLGMLLLALPFAAVGTVANYLPYRLCGIVADRAGAGSLDMPATYKLYFGLLAFPLTWLVEAGAVAACAPWAVALGTAGALPLLGYAALAFWEREDRLRTEADAWWVLRRRPGLADRLRRRKAALVAEIAALAGTAFHDP